MDFDEEILKYYNKGNERERLDDGLSQIEKVRTLDILERYIPKTASSIVDIGGGTGVYSFLLSEKGFDVHLLDAIPLHINQAKEINKSSKHPLKSLQVGDARNLPFEDNFADIVLLFGPMYHLIKKGDRLKTLEEAFRILKTGGMIFSVGISKFASLLDGFKKDFILDEGFRKIANEDLRTSQHRNPTNKEHYFTTAFFHDPNELLIEHIEVGFNQLELLAIEGPLGLLENIINYVSDQQNLEIFLDYAKKIEKETSLIGASSHIMVIAKKE